jgi:hypothetical protein
VSLIFDGSSSPSCSATLSTTSSYVCCFDLDYSENPKHPSAECEDLNQLVQVGAGNGD